MVSKRMLERTAEEIHRACGANLMVADPEGRIIVTAGEAPETEMIDQLLTFAHSSSLKVQMADRYFARVNDLSEPVCVIAAGGTPAAYKAGKLLESMIGLLLDQKREGFQKEDFFRKLLQGRLLPSQAGAFAQELGIDASLDRTVYVIEIPDGRSFAFADRLISALSREIPDYVMMGRREVIVIHESARSQAAEEKALKSMEETMVRCAAEEAGGTVRIACGSRCSSLMDLRESRIGALRALEIGRRFSLRETVLRIDDLILEQLISYVPYSLCKRFLEKFFSHSGFFDQTDEEMIKMAIVYIDNTMNASETARQLFFHRNSLRYRLRHIKVASGLDLRKFRDAVLFKTGHMIHQYMKTESNKEVNYEFD